MICAVRALAVTLCLLVATPIASAAENTAPPQTVADKARCPVCGMFPARYPQWKAQIVFTDGSASAFDSPVELFIFLGDMAKYDPRHTRQSVAAIYVSDYGQKTWVGAAQAFFVHGSHATGPMNDANLPAFATRAAAEAFARAQGGTVLTFENITPALLRSLQGDVQDQAGEQRDSPSGHRH